MAFIKLESVSVSFPIHNASSRSLKGHLVSTATGGSVALSAGHSLLVEAIKNLSLTIEHGDRIGLVGHNGAGKSTLLRILAGIYEPMRGSIEVEGKVVPIFDIGLGFDPEGTGYENVRLRGLYLGMDMEEIECRIDDIAVTSGLGQFLEMPLRTYSTGMMARLAFAVSTAVEPDILLMDEGIGVGDAAFVEQARTRLAELIDRTGIMVFASHSDELLRQLCNKAVLMQKGEAIHMGSVEEVLEKYHG